MYTLRRAPGGGVVLPKVSVSAAGGEKAGGPVHGYAAKRSATGTRTDTPLIQTPVSVQVVSREVMDDQQVLTVSDAIKNVSGVYVRQGPDGNTMDSFNIRGFQVHNYRATYLDGVKDFSRAPKEMAGLERIEVLKGPAAIMSGALMVAACGAAYAGLVALCVGVDRHHRQLRPGKKKPARRELLIIRCSGWLLLALSLWIGLRAWGGSIGWVAWFGVLSAVTSLLVLQLTYAPRWILTFACIGGLVALPVLLI